MASGIGPRSHLLTVLLLSGTIVLGQGAVPDSFKRAVAAGHYRVALKLVAADKDTTGLLPGYLDAETKAVVKEAMGVSAAPCAATILRALYARTLLDYSSQESGTTRAVASLAEHIRSLIQSADPACLSSVQDSVLLDLNASPHYTGVLAVEYMGLFPVIPGSQVNSFLVRSRWVSPLLDKHNTLASTGAVRDLSAFFIEAIAITGAMQYAATLRESMGTALAHIPTAAEYLLTAQKVYGRARASKQPKIARYMSMYALPYALLLSDEANAKQLMTEENLAAHLHDLTESLENYARTSWPRSMKWMVDLEPLYYLSVASLFSLPLSPERARSERLHAAEIIAGYTEGFRSALGTCPFAQLSSRIDGDMVIYGYDTAEVSGKLMALYQEVDSSYVQCARVLDSDSINATWSPFQTVFSTACALSKYETVAAIMAEASDQLVRNDHDQEFSTSWMDFMADQFMGSFRPDTVQNSAQAARWLNAYVRNQITLSRTWPDHLISVSGQRLALRHLAVAEMLAVMKGEDRCGAVRQMTSLVERYQSASDLVPFAKMLSAECVADTASLLQYAREVTGLTTTDENAEVKSFCYSMVQAYDRKPQPLPFYNDYIALHRMYYGPCSALYIGSISTALGWYSTTHPPREALNQMNEWFNAHYNPDCQKTIDWLALHNQVRGVLLNQLELIKILDLDMNARFAELRPSDCTTIGHSEAYIHWRIAHYQDYSEAEARGREALSVLERMHAGGERVFLAAKPIGLRHQYLSLKLLAYTTMCSAFSNVLDPQPDSLCHYTALMASIIGSVPEMHLDFGEELERREAECSALRGSNTQQFTVLLNHSEAAALSDRDFSAYATWFNQEMTDSVVSLRKRLELSDWDGLLRRIEHIDAEYAFLLGEARSRLDAMAYMGLLQGRATWEFRAANRDHLVTQLASMYERYPQSNRSGYNVLANLSPNQRSGVIFRDKYQKEWGALEACDALPGLGNILFDASHWRTLDPPKARAMVQQAVDSLARCSIATTNEAKAWRNLVRLSVPIAIEYDAVGSMGAFIKLMRAGRPVLEAHGELDKGGAAGEEYTLLLDLLQTAQERSVPTRGLESGLLGYLQRVDRTGDMAASLLASRAYAALVTRNPQAPPSPRILNHILTHLSDVLWYDYLVQNELLLTRDLSFQMNTFWSVVETALMKWDHPGSDLDTLLNIIPEALAIQLRLYAVNPQERIGSLDFCREELLDKLWDAHWARDPTKRQRDKEFTALYLATKRAFKDDRIHDMFADGGAQESIARFNAMLDQTGIAGGRRFMREEALTRYAEFGIEGLVDRANCFIRYPEIWSYFPTQASVALFNRNELSDSYQAVYMSADTVEVVNVGTIAAVEAAWREWLAAMENGNDALAAEKARIFWDPIVQRTASDAGVEQFVLVPDGIYYNVNPAALPIESTGRVRVDVVTDLFTYLLKSIPTNTMGPVYLFGGLDYGGEAPRTFALSASLRADRGLEHGRWMGLPGTKWEVDAIEGKFTRQEDLVFKGTGDSVSVTTLENMAFPRLVHIATHGFVYEGEGGAHSAGLVLSGANNETAEANRSYLYTERIRNLDLFACDAVILSACRTARSTSGSGQGEIIKAFKDAGTDKVIASSWAVPDECTALLMDKFYDYYLQGVSVSQALTEAQRKVAERYPEKRYWAAFMVYE